MSLINKSYIDFNRIQDEAYHTFWGLGDHWWKQIIDKEYQEFGPLVFDEGLHNKEAEPGFYASLQMGCAFASGHLCEKMDLTAYKTLNRILCSHFKGRETSTEIDASEAGRFRNHPTSCHFYFKTLSAEAKYYYEFADIGFLARKAPKIRKSHLQWGQWLVINYSKSSYWIKRFEEELEFNIRHINGYIEKVCKEMDIPKIAELEKKRDYIELTYLCQSEKELESIAEKFFQRYENKKKKNQLKAIGELFQLLEWLHPFPDGQGRSDLVVLSKLLSEEGFHPPILEKPYVSSYTMPEEWHAHLLKGLKSWEKEKKAKC